MLVKSNNRSELATELHLALQGGQWNEGFVNPFFLDVLRVNILNQRAASISQYDPTSQPLSLLNREIN